MGFNSGFKGLNWDQERKV